MKRMIEKVVIDLKTDLITTFFCADLPIEENVF